MNSLASVLSHAESIVLDLELEGKKRVFEEIGSWLAGHPGMSQQEVYDCLLAREKLGSTGLGQGVAIPHGRLEGLTEAVGFFIRLTHPISFNAPDNEPVDLLFVLLVPQEATGMHLQVLSLVAQFFSSKDNRDALRRAQNADAVYQLFRDEE